MPKLSDVTHGRATVRVPIGDVALQITYRPDVITPRFQKAVQAAQVTQDVDSFLCWPLSELIADWDLTEDDGTPVATTPDAIGALPVPLLLAILNAITEDMAPNSTRGAASSNGSSPTAGSATSPAGTST